MVAVPPHILRAIAQSKAAEHICRSAQLTLEHTERVLQTRRQSFLSRESVSHRQQIVPPHILRNIAESDADEGSRESARESLGHLQTIIGKVRDSQPESQQVLEASDHDSTKPSPKGPYRAIHDIHESSNEEKLPGKLKWLSIDNKNMDVISTVHFGRQYENAFWDPEKLQMVFGDGGEFLNNFVGCIDVIGHELTHAVTADMSPLDYYGQAGALNEHISDVFGIMVKQQVQDEKSPVADWLIGEDCILPGIKGTALRSMKEPGTAYDDPIFGKDPQVAHMKQFKTTFEDNGGVHIFSGIPNRAFYLASNVFGGYSWEKAGKIWWAAMRSGKIEPRCTFKGFADVTIHCANELFDDKTAKVIKKAWVDVGVLDDAGTESTPGNGCGVL
ncbi:protealysin [Fusarium langsethiae]|uniref:Protealysin n=1 Tax=Fusarium langsethiae TaxID=179993 RepID=A0A0N1J2Q3_FUSLA|nr:protealysin [Fusarium langsethiae]GKU18643.1 unnamed protein product [Fusarium langsethiae]